ncbi:YitT family protein [Desertibacillus haloalkaliphilus]|uniref:YitT family protein n=1 Tax=Desertibacillus haloalkaliphilus TaxID=1328930 RepID=UPI001C27766A|nr:YitT family protein [Desertibacillus haloalkaliphilus]MBU8908777.1 YitT family protein [Desertibacillus haloalkaliphilus]
MFMKVSAVLIGSFLISFGINNFFVPHKILDGGIIGLGLIVHYQWGFNIGTTILLTSIPIYIYAWVYYRSFFINSIVGLVVSALFIDLFSFVKLPILQTSPLLDAIIGGLLLGVGVGAMFIYDISTGGLDLFAQMIAEAIKINVGIVVFIVDLIVVASGIVVISPQELVLSTIAVAATGIATTLLTIDPVKKYIIESN